MAANAGDGVKIPLPVMLRAWWETRARVRSLRLARAQQIVSATFTSSLTVRVTVHAADQARERYDHEAFDVLEDVIVGMRAGRQGARSPAGHSARGDAFCVWDTSQTRTYIVKRVRGGWVIITTLPPHPLRQSGRLHAVAGLTAVADAFRRAGES